MAVRVAQGMEAFDHRGRGSHCPPSFLASGGKAFHIFMGPIYLGRTHEIGPDWGARINLENRQAREHVNRTYNFLVIRVRTVTLY